jgi:hypothetical protein
MSTILPIISKTNLTNVINSEFDNEDKFEKEFANLVTIVTTSASVTTAKPPTGTATSSGAPRRGVKYVDPNKKDKISSVSSEADSKSGVSSITQSSVDDNENTEKFEDNVKYLMVLILTKTQLQYNLDTYKQKQYESSPSLLENCGYIKNWKNITTVQICNELLTVIKSVISDINREFNNYIINNNDNKYVIFFNNSKRLIKIIENVKAEAEAKTRGGKSGKSGKSGKVRKSRKMRKSKKYNHCIRLKTKKYTRKSKGKSNLTKKRRG